MTRVLALLALAACAPKIPVGPVAADDAERPARFVELPDPTSPNVYLQAVIRAGSAWDPVGREGLAALVAQSLIDAGAGGRSSSEVRDALYPTGNAFDLVVDRELVSVRLRCHRDHAALCADLFADAILEPSFDPGDVQRLREAAEYAVGDELLSSEEALGHEFFDAVLWEGHPYGHPVRGRGGALPTLTPDHARAFHARHYVRSQVVLGIAGAWPEGTVEALKERFAALPGGLPPELPLQRALPVEGRSVAIVDVGDGSSVTGFHFGHPVALDRNHPDFPALTLAMTALGAHRQSFGRLFRTLRTARGLNYGTYAYVEAYTQRGWTSLPENGVVRRQNHFYTWVRPTSLDNGPFALRLALAEVERLDQHGLEPQEFEDVRDYLQGWVPTLAQDPGRRLAFALDAEAAGTPDLLTALPSALEQLTLEAANEAIARHLDPANLKIVAVTGDPEGLRARLLGAEPTPIVYRDVAPDAAQTARDLEVASWPLGLEPDDVWVVDAQGLFR